MPVDRPLIDAAGRAAKWDSKGTARKDHSCADRMFAANNNVSFSTPDTFFKGMAEAPFTWGAFDKDNQPVPCFDAVRWLCSRNHAVPRRTWPAAEDRPWIPIISVWASCAPNSAGACASWAPGCTAHGSRPVSLSLPSLFLSVSFSFAFPCFIYILCASVPYARATQRTYLKNLRDPPVTDSIEWKRRHDNLLSPDQELVLLVGQPVLYLCCGARTCRHMFLGGCLCMHSCVYACALVGQTARHAVLL